MMTVKQRWLAAMALEPSDRIPFWPKLGGNHGSYHGPPFKSMSSSDMHAWIGSDTHIGIPSALCDKRRRTTIREQFDRHERRILYETPFGGMRAVHHFDEGSQAWHPLIFPITDVEDLKRMTAIYEDATVSIDPVALQQARDTVAAIGENAVTAATIGTSPLMWFVEWLAGIETGHYLLVDHPDTVLTLFNAMQRVLKRQTALLCEHSPADFLYLSENTSTTLIAPNQYRQYNVPQVMAVARQAQAAQRLLILHMCGHLKALLPDLAKIPARAFEAFTSPTLGNTTLLDGRTVCPDHCLIGGTNAMLWTRSTDEIITRIAHDLDALPHHRGIVLTSAGVMPPQCKPETIRHVGEWLKSYPVRMQ